MLMILGQLPLLSRVALALTSKSLFTTLFPTGRVPILGHHPGDAASLPPKTPELSDRDKLLLMLEMDDPDLVFCFDCRRLCAFDSGRGHLNCSEPAVVKYRYYPYDRRSKPHPPLTPRARGWAYEHDAKVHPLAWMPEAKWPAVNFATARLVMNRYLYGKPYGLPLSSLDYKYEFERFIDLKKRGIDSHFPLDRHPQGRQHLTRKRLQTIQNSYILNSEVSAHPWAFKHSSQAKIIDNELYIARFHSISGPLVDRRDFIHLLDSLELPICRHIGFHRRSLATFARGKFRGPYEFDCVVICKASAVSRVWSCIDCFTDYSVSIWEEERGDWNCELATYHRLGPCRDPSDPIWKLIIWSSCDEPEKIRLRLPPRVIPRVNLDEFNFYSFPWQSFGMHDESRRPGFIRLQWQESNGETDNQAAAWIDGHGKPCTWWGCGLTCRSEWRRWRRFE